MAVSETYITGTYFYLNARNLILNNINFKNIHFKKNDNTPALYLYTLY